MHIAKVFSIILHSMVAGLIKQAIEIILRGTALVLGLQCCQRARRNRSKKRKVLPSSRPYGAIINPVML